jgi:hypothetical protein
MKYILSVIFLSISLLNYGQVKQPERYEIELDPFEEPYSVLSGEDNGVLLYQALDEYESGRQLWQFINLDTTLNEAWGKEYFIDRDHIFKGYEYHDHSYYFLFQLTARRSHNLLLLEINGYTGDTLMHTIKNLVPLDLTVFEMSNSAALIGGYYIQEPVVMHYDLSTKKTKVLPGIFGDKTKLVQVKIEPELINILVTTRTFDKRNTLAIKTYDSQGNYLDNYIFEPGGDIGLIDGRIADIGEVSSIISGTYGARRSDHSRGLFVAQHRMGKGQTIKYFNFADLDNFFTYLKARRQSRISNRIDRKKIKGKKIKFNYRLLVHEIIESGDTYIMLGEAYYPKYTNNNIGSSYLTYSPGGANYMPASFAGYMYTHAVVIGFNKNGERLWDNSFQIEDVLTYSLDQYVHADALNGKVVLFYLYNDEIRTKIISGSDVLEGKSYNSVKLMFADDVASKNGISNIGGLEKWYGHNFLAYGVQKIKNLKDTGVKLNRRVFYLNKILYSDPPPDTTALNE